MEPFASLKKVLVGISGSVDSAVAAALLKNQGSDVIGCFLNLWDPEMHSEGVRFSSRCCSRSTSEDAKSICEKLDIPFVSIDLRDQFYENVIDDLVHETIQKRSCYPCVPCNDKVKFRALIEKAKELGCTGVATGHYAQLIRDSINGNIRLTRAADESLDQSYLLWGLKQSELRQLIMPLGSVPGQMVIKLAREFDLKDSSASHITPCFLGDPHLKQFIELKTPPQLRPEGAVRTLEGSVVGAHKGLYLHPLGTTMEGVSLSIPDPEKWFSVGYDTSTHALVIGPEQELYRMTGLAVRANWTLPIEGLKPQSCLAKVGARPKLIGCELMIYENDTVVVEFSDPIRSLSPGEPIVFYLGNEVLGGAWLDRIASDSKLNEVGRPGSDGPILT